MAAPTHFLFADGVLIFCNGALHNIQVIFIAFELYRTLLGQIVNLNRFYSYLSNSISIS